MKSIETKIRKVVIARCDSGEDLFEALTTLVKEYYVVSGHFQVMGALSHGKVGIFENRQYVWMEHSGALEISSCVGNVAVKEGQPLVHCHAVLNDHNGKLIAGHVAKGCIVNPTAEIHLTVHDGEVTRKLDEPSGLWKLNL